MLDVFQIADRLEKWVLEPAILDILTEKAARVRILIYHLADDLTKVRVIAIQSGFNTILQATDLVLVQLLVCCILLNVEEVGVRKSALRQG